MTLRPTAVPRTSPPILTTPTLEPGPHGTTILWFTDEIDASTYTRAVRHYLGGEVVVGLRPHNDVGRMVTRCYPLDMIGLPYPADDLYAVLQRTDTLDGSDQ